MKSPEYSCVLWTHDTMCSVAVYDIEPTRGIILGGGTVAPPKEKEKRKKKEKKKKEKGKRKKEKKERREL